MEKYVNEGQLQIEPWGEDDLPLLRLLNAPDMMNHLGGPETEEKLLARHQRYLTIEGNGCMYRVVLLPDGCSVGSVGYWEREWNGEVVCEIGWSVLPSYQGKGIATKAVAAVIEAVRGQCKYNSVHAFPSIHNPPSNALCRKLGFSLMRECDFEYPKGSFMRCNDWQLALTAAN